MHDPIAAIAVAACAAVVAVILLVLYRWLERRSRVAGFFGMVVVTAWGTEYVLRPFHVLSAGEFGQERGSPYVLSALDPGSLPTASLLTLVCTAILALSIAAGFGVARPRAWHRDDGSDHPAGGSQRQLRLRVPLPLLALVSLTASTAIALQAGPIGAALAGEPGRQRLGSGYAYVLVNLAGLAVLVALTAIPRHLLARRRTVAVFAVCYVAFLSLHLLVLGGRSEIVILTVALVCIVLYRTQRPRSVILWVCVVLASLGFAVYRVATREAFAPDQHGLSTADLIADSLRDPVALLTQHDVSAYDKLVMLEEAGRRPAWGRTYLAALSVPLPLPALRSLEGGNRSFTKEFVPTRYDRNVTFDGISMLGEAQFNFGKGGAVAVVALVGLAYGKLLRAAHRGGGWLVSFALGAGLFPSLLRADALNTVALGGSLLVIAGFMYRVIRQRYGALDGWHDGSFGRGPNGRVGAERSEAAPVT